MKLLIVAWRSLQNRWSTSVLTVIAIALGVALFVGIERVRLGARESFTSAISQTDLIVGARGGSLPLLLYSVFHIGNATNNISYQSYQHFKAHPAVKWTIPYSLGDSHRSYRVVATDETFYREYRYRGERALEFSQGRAAHSLFDVVIGSEIANKLSYKLGSQIVLAHGVSEDASLFDHGDKPFTVVGILQQTGTPIDRALYITLQGMEAIHSDWGDGTPPPPPSRSTQEALEKQIPTSLDEITVSQITSFLLRGNSRLDALRLQRDILDFEPEALMAIIPGVALGELWNNLSYAEDSLRMVSLFVILVGILGLLANLLASLNERRREIAILRALGTRPRQLVSLIVFETLTLTVLGIVVGLLGVYASLSLSQSWLQSNFNLYIPLIGLRLADWLYLGLLIVASITVGFVVAYRAYKQSLADGLNPKI